MDNGTEFTSKALDEWAWRRGVKLDYTRPGKPTDKGLIESFNGRLGDEFLDVNEFIRMQDARQKLKPWQHDYNHHRPHGSLGHLTRVSLSERGQINRCKAAQLRLEVTGYGGDVGGDLNLEHIQIVTTLAVIHFTFVLSAIGISFAERLTRGKT